MYKLSIYWLVVWLIVLDGWLNSQVRKLDLVGVSLPGGGKKIPPFEKLVYFLCSTNSPSVSTPISAETGLLLCHMPDAAVVGHGLRMIFMSSCIPPPGLNSRRSNHDFATCDLKCELTAQEWHYVRALASVCQTNVVAASNNALKCIKYASD